MPKVSGIFAMGDVNFPLADGVGGPTLLTRPMNGRRGVEGSLRRKRARSCVSLALQWVAVLGCRGGVSGGWAL